jgi:hypothetical protein
VLVELLVLPELPQGLLELLPELLLRLLTQYLVLFLVLPLH